MARLPSCATPVPPVQPAKPVTVQIANSFWRRLRGQIGRPPLRADELFFLPYCGSVHTCFMVRPLDLVYLDDQLKIVRLVEGLVPWRLSVGGPGVVHVLELAPGAIDALGFCRGMSLSFLAKALCVNAEDAGRDPNEARRIGRSENGSAMVEFAVVSPIILAAGLLALQYALMFVAKNQLAHASFMAARAGSVAHADLASVSDAYARALTPLYGGGTDPEAIAESLARATADVQAHARIELLNPTRESFDDWSDPALVEKYGRRAIPNAAQAARDPGDVKPSSGQNIQDANLLKVRITHGYELKVPLAGTLMQFLMKWNDAGNDSFLTAQYDSRRIPVVSHVTLHMQSDAWEPDKPASSTGRGNGGAPNDPGPAPETLPPVPRCLTIDCGEKGGGSDKPSGPGNPQDPPGCGSATYLRRPALPASSSN